MTKTDRLNAWVRQCADRPERGIDRAEVRRALGILVAPDQTFCLQSLPSAQWRICPGTDPDAAVEAAYEISDGAGVYFTLNPCRSGLTTMPRNDDIVGRRWLLIDVDRKGAGETNASDPEKLLVTEVAYRVSDYLWDASWPNPVMTDSGNGNHLYYRVDLPNDPLSRSILKAVLAELKSRFDTPRVEIDGKVIDARRISKLPGSWARKGPHTDDRPHRLARLVYVPDPLEVVSVEQLQAVGASTAAPVIVASAVPSPHLNGTTLNAFVARAVHGGSDLTHYVQSAIDRECARVELTPVGGRNNALNVAAHNLGTLAMWPEMILCDARAALVVAALRAGLTDFEARKTIESGWLAGAAKPRPRPVPASHGPKIAMPNGQPTISPIIWGNQIKPRKVEWLWPRRIPIGKMTTFAGQTGMGKTFAVCDIAARITRGMEIPFGGGECFQQGKVLIISAEDDADDTLLPRFLEMGGDASKLAFLTPEAEDKFSLAALDMLNQSLDHMAGDIRMVAIDPPTSYMGSVDDHKNAQLRGLLAPLRRWSIRRAVALVMITHVNKAIGQKVEAIARVMGGSAWVTGVRAAHMFCPNPDVPNSNLFVCLKINNGPKPSTLSYQIDPTTADQAVIKWIEEVDMTADEAMGGGKKKTRGLCAVEWLIARFRERREWTSADLKRDAAEAGISKNALWSAEVNALPIKKRERMNASGDKCWYWIAEPDWPPPDK